MTDKNPLIEDQSIDTLHNIENHLRFINDYFASKQNDPDCADDIRIWHGLNKTLDMSIEAIRFEIDRSSKEK